MPTIEKSIDVNVPVRTVQPVVQHTRRDSRQAENALLSTITYADND